MNAPFNLKRQEANFYVQQLLTDLIALGVLEYESGFENAINKTFKPKSDYVWARFFAISEGIGGSMANGNEQLPGKLHIWPPNTNSLDSPTPLASEETASNKALDHQWVVTGLKKEHKESLETLKVPAYFSFFTFFTFLLCAKISKIEYSNAGSLENFSFFSKLKTNSKIKL